MSHITRKLRGHDDNMDMAGNAFISTTATGSAQCYCLGPQNGDKHCPCVMRSMAAQWPARGEPMPQTQDYWVKRALMDQELILEMKAEISKLKQTVNNLRQRSK